MLTGSGRERRYLDSASLAAPRWCVMPSLKSKRHSLGDGFGVERVAPGGASPLAPQAPSPCQVFSLA
jgi:hypothetical protein